MLRKIEKRVIKHSKFLCFFSTGIIEESIKTVGWEMNSLLWELNRLTDPFEKENTRCLFLKQLMELV